MSAQSKKVICLGALMAIGAFNMGNSGCSQQSPTTPPPRILKMDVEIGAISGHAVTLPDGSVLDFPYVVNSLFGLQVINYANFVVMNRIAIPGATGTAPLVTAKLSVDQSEDSNLQLLRKYGFIGDTDGSGKTFNKLQLAAQDTPAPVDPLACVYNNPQTVLGGSLISFEMTDGFGVRIGYDSTGLSTPTGGVGAHINFTQSKLDLALRMDDLLTQEPQFSTEGKSYQNGVNVGLDIGVLPIGFDFFFKTAISDVIKSSMAKALSGIVTDLIAAKSTTGNWQDVWESRVILDKDLANNDTHIVMRGGSRYNTKVGDRFYVQNMDYKWEGDPCNSRLRYKMAIGLTPIAIAEIVAQDNDVAVAEVKQYLTEDRIQAGAKVTIQSLLAPTTPTPTPVK